MSRKKILKFDQLSNFAPLTIGDRVNYIIAENKLSGRKFCEIMEISSGNLNSIINDDSKPSSDFLFRLLEQFKININWLLTGRGSRLLGTAIAESSIMGNGAHPLEGGDPMDESKVIRSLRALINQQQATIDALLDQIDDSKKSNAVSE